MYDGFRQALNTALNPTGMDDAGAAKVDMLVNQIALDATKSPTLANEMAAIEANIAAQAVSANPFKVELSDATDHVAAYDSQSNTMALGSALFSALANANAEAAVVLVAHEGVHLLDGNDARSIAAGQDPIVAGNVQTLRSEGNAFWIQAKITVEIAAANRAQDRADLGPAANLPPPKQYIDDLQSIQGAGYYGSIIPPNILLALPPVDFSRLNTDAEYQNFSALAAISAFNSADSMRSTSAYGARILNAMGTRDERDSFMQQVKDWTGHINDAALDDTYSSYNDYLFNLAYAYQFVQFYGGFGNALLDGMFGGKGVAPLLDWAKRSFTDVKNGTLWLGQSLGNALSKTGAWLGRALSLFGGAHEVGDPILISNQDGQFSTITLDSSHAFVDYDGLGIAHLTAWVTPDIGVLVAKAADGSWHILGSQGTSAVQELTSLYTGADGLLSPSDPGFASVGVWLDRDGNGNIDDAEVYSLSDFGVSSIQTVFDATTAVIPGASITATSVATMWDGTTRNLAMVNFDINPTITHISAPLISSELALSLPQLHGYGALTDLRTSMTSDTNLSDLVQNLDLLLASAPYDMSALQGIIGDIMFEWAGASGEDPAALGPELDSRRLLFLERFTGNVNTFLGHYDTQGRDPGLLPALMSNESFLSIRNGLLARLVIQQSPMFSQAFTYDARLDVVDPVGSLESSLQLVAAQIGPVCANNLGAWEELASVVGAVGSSFGPSVLPMSWMVASEGGYPELGALISAEDQGLSMSISPSGQLTVSNAPTDGILIPGFGRVSGLSFFYAQGDGAVALAFSEPAWLLYYQGRADNTLYINGNAAAFSWVTQGNGDVVLTDGISGDILTLVGQALTGDGIEHGIQQFVYTDGNIRTWSGDQETYALAVGYGNVADAPIGHQDTVALGSGIRLSDVRVRIDPATGALVLTAGQDSMTIQGNYAPGASTTRVSSITFADGTTWGMDGSYAFGRGEGQQTWDTGGQDGHVRMGDDIDPRDVILQSDAAGDLTVALRSDPADSITFTGDLYAFVGGTSSHIRSLDFGDGSSLDLTGPRLFTWIGDASHTTLVGSGWGADEFDLGPGGDTVTAASPVPEVSAPNTFLFGRGDGQATVDMNGGTGVLEMGAGISASDLLLQAHADGSLTVALRDDAADSITFLHDLSISFQNQTTQVSSITFADGSSMSLQGPITSGWIGDDAGDPLVGSNFGPNVFELGTALTSVSFGWAYPNTVITAPGGGGATATANGGTGTLSLSGVSLSDVYFQTTTGSPALTVRFRDGALGPITVSDDLTASFGNYASQLQTVQADDGAEALAQVTSTWIADAQHTTLTGSNWGPDVFETGSAYATINADQSQPNEVVVHPGDQGATVNMNGGTGVLVLKGISISDVYLQSTGNYSGSLGVGFVDGIAGTVIVPDDLWTYFGTVHAHVASIVADDGSIDLFASRTFTWFGGASAATLTGSGWGANKFIFGPGGDTAYLGDGSQGGSNQNTVLWGRGDGHAIVHVGGGSGTVQLGAGIAASDVMFQADAAGDLTIAIKGDTADTITLDGDLYSYFGVHSRLSVSLADGTTIPFGAQPDGSYATPRFTWQQTLPGQAMTGTTWGSNDFLLAPGGSTLTTEGDVNSGNYADTISYDRGDGQVTATVYDSYLQALKLGSGFTASDVLLQQDAGTNDLVVAFRGDAADRIVFPSVLYSDGWGVLDQVRGIQFQDGSYLPTGIPYWGQGGPLTFTWVADVTHTSLAGSGYGGNVFEAAPGGDTITLGNGANGGSAANVVRYHAGDGTVAVVPNGGSAQLAFIGIREADVTWSSDQAGDLVGSVAGSQDAITVRGALSTGSDIQASFGDGTLTKAQLAFAASEVTAGAISVNGTAGDDLLDGHGVVPIVYGDGGSDSYVFRAGYGAMTVVNEHAANAGPEGRMLLGTGVDASDLWLAQSGFDLVGTVLGTADSFTLKDWFSGDATAQLSSILGGDGRTLDTGIGSVVSAMASYAAAHPGFSPGAASSMPMDTTLQGVLAGAWHR